MFNVDLAAGWVSVLHFGLPLLVGFAASAAVFLSGRGMVGERAWRALPYLVFDPNTLIGNLKALVVGGLIVFVAVKVAGAVGFGKVTGAIVAVLIGAIGFMVVQGTLLQDLAGWLQKSGGG